MDIDSGKRNIDSKESIFEEQVITEVEIEKVGSDEDSNAEIVKEDDFEMIEQTEIEKEFTMLDKIEKIEKDSDEKFKAQIEALTEAAQKVE